MKRLVLITALLVMTALSAGGVFAHMDEGAGKMEKGEKYEMMTPGGKHMMGPGMRGQSSEECWMGGRSWMGGHGMMGGHMHWMFIGFGLVKVVVIGLFFWLFFRIAKSLEKIATSRVAKE